MSDKIKEHPYTKIYRSSTKMIDNFFASQKELMAVPFYKDFPRVDLKSAYNQFTKDCKDRMEMKAMMEEYYKKN